MAFPARVLLVSASAPVSTRFHSLEVMTVSTRVGRLDMEFSSLATWTYSPSGAIARNQASTIWLTTRANELRIFELTSMMLIRKSCMAQHVEYATAAFASMSTFVMLTPC